ncbi:ESX secretion-associated protein EspG [Nocardia sp. NPDC023852]|uniref:ESX secretion-associated protein EspG n=1 Tax=Nocardia sp. NPDC023852 TaxID=3154697 RepID=UPI0033F4DDD6
MSMRQWTFSALGYAVLWRGIDRDVLPYPLQYRSGHDTVDAYVQEWKTEAADLAQRMNEDIYTALRLLDEPEARIEATGFAGAATRPADLLNGGDPQHRIRVHAAVHHRHAVLLTQEPTVSSNSGGRVRMSLIDADNVARHVLGALPDTARGTGAALQVSRHDLDDEDRPFTAFHDDAPQPPREQAQRFFERLRSAIVHIAVHPGPAWDNRPSAARDLHVMDFPDGRYLVRHSAHEIRAEPADTTTLNTCLRRLIDTTVRTYREDNDPDYCYT